MLLSSIFTALVAASVAHAHATFQELWVNGGTTVPSVPLDDDADDFISLLSGQSRFLCPVTRQQQPSDRVSFSSLVYRSYSDQLLSFQCHLSCEYLCSLNFVG